MLMILVGVKAVDVAGVAGAADAGWETRSKAVAEAMVDIFRIIFCLLPIEAGAPFLDSIWFVEVPCFPCGMAGVKAWWVFRVYR
ncbi:hypothetical protein GCM10018790_04190 [Kitasatospora xanthocidica]|nr:hypothetical protein GCM10018790_04190 [Kitasatospora xanthocidica]